MPRTPPRTAGGILRQLEFASFPTSGQTSIQATATDANGNVFVTGTTNSPDLPVKNAYQPNFAEAHILKTNDLGATWTRVPGPPDASAAIFPDPVSAQILYASGTTGIYKTTDGGQTWAMVYAFASSFLTGGGAMAIDPGNPKRLVAVVPSTGALIRSIDGGATWNSTTVSCPVSNCGGKLFADPSGSGALVSFTLNLNLSRDFGATFHQISPPGPGSLSTVAFDPSHPGWIYADTAAGVMGTLSLSMDYGATWTTKASPPTTFSAITSLAVDPQQPSTLVASSLDAVYKSTDGANSWTLVSGPGASFLLQTQDPFVLLGHQCAPNGAVAAIGGGGLGTFQVAFSTDYGATFGTPQFTGVSSLIAGPSCSVYLMRQPSTDAFLSKLAPDGTVLWTTYFGGEDQDAPVGIAADAAGNVYVAGNTTSLDFPATKARIGPVGQGEAFLARFTPEGKLDYSVLIGGEGRNTAMAVAVDHSGIAYVSGTTNSKAFPVSEGTLVAGGSPGSFLVKWNAAGNLAYAIQLGPSYVSASSMLANDDGSVVVSGAGAIQQTPSGSTLPAFVIRVNPTGTQILASAFIPGVLPTFPPSGSLTADAQGNLFVAGQILQNAPFPGSPGYRQTEPLPNCPENIYTSLTGTGVFVVKLAAADWTPVYSALLQAPCGIKAGSLVVDTNGSAMVGLATGRGVPLHNPLVGGPTCSFNSSAVAKLSADGTALEYASYMDNCGVPALALAGDGTIYAGVSPRGSQNPAGVLHLRPPAPPAFSLDQVANHFSGNTSAVAFGGLYALSGAGFTFPSNDLGLKQNLPFLKGSVQVMFDGTPAPILHTGPGSVVVVAPTPENAQNRGFTAVQVVFNGTASNIVLMPVAKSSPGLLTVDLPDLPHARNADGTRNDADHPAPIGSSVMLYATGMGAANPLQIAGSVAKPPLASPVLPVFSSLEFVGPALTPRPNPLDVSTVDGLLSALFQVRIDLPSSAQNLGAPAGNGARVVPVALQFQVSPSSSIPPASNVVMVYFK